MTLIRPTDPASQESPSKRAVIAADPRNPAIPPAGAIAAEFRDANGRVIAWAWVAPEHAGQRYYDEAWAWLERHAPEAPTCHLKLVVDP